MASRALQTARDAAKGIASCNLKVTAMAEGNMVRVQLPKPTAEYRQSLVRLAREAGEQVKQSVRRHRSHGIRDVRRTAASKDDQVLLERQLQQLHDATIRQIDDLVASKCKQIDSA